MHLSCSDKLMMVVCAAPSILASVKDVEGESDLFSVGGATVDMCCVEIIHRAFAYTQRSTGQGHTQAALQYAHQQCTHASALYKGSLNACASKFRPGWVKHRVCCEMSKRSQRLSCSAGSHLSTCQVLLVISTCLHSKACHRICLKTRLLTASTSHKQLLVHDAD